MYSLEKGTVTLLYALSSEPYLPCLANSNFLVFLEAANRNFLVFLEAANRNLLVFLKVTANHYSPVFLEAGNRNFPVFYEAEKRNSPCTISVKSVHSQFHMCSSKQGAATSTVPCTAGNHNKPQLLSNLAGNRNSSVSQRTRNSPVFCKSGSPQLPCFLHIVERQLPGSFK